MAGDRSSANPAKLLGYTAASGEMDAVLQAKAAAVLGACTRLRLAQTLNPFDDSYSVGLGDIDQQLADLAADWQHLDAFAADVAQGFITANQLTGAPRPRSTDSVLSFADGYLSRVGHIGYADRDDAIEAADQMAAELDRLWQQGHASVEEIEDLVAMAEVGQHDAAFAVALSEQIGVEGYVRAVTLIRYGYGGGSRELEVLRPVLDEGQVADVAAATQVLGTTLTTALATRDDDTEPPPGDRLDQGFVDDLVSGHDPFRGLDQDSEPAALTRATEDMVDLSVLLRFTDPPTDIAVEIAQHRLTPWLAPDRTRDVTDWPGAWGELASPIGNYATMLGRNPDASALWLDREIDPSTLWSGSSVTEGTRNIEWALQHDRSGDYTSDAATGLAQVVENGVTHPDDGRRQRLMGLAIETIAEQGEVRSDPFYAALADGVDANMDVVDHRINDGWNLALVDEAPSEDARATYDFLHALMADADTADRLHVSGERYLMDQLSELPPPDFDPDGDRTDARTVALRELGAIQGALVGAENDALIDSVEDYIARQQQKAAAVDFAVGMIPYVEEAVGPLASANDLAQVGGRSVGGFLFPADLGQMSEEQQIARLREADAYANSGIFLALAEHPERTTIPVRDMSDGERQALIDWVNSGGMYDGNDLSDLYTGTTYSASKFQGGGGG